MQNITQHSQSKTYKNIIKTTQKQILHRNKNTKTKQTCINPTQHLTQNQIQNPTTILHKIFSPKRIQNNTTLFKIINKTYTKPCTEMQKINTKITHKI